MKRWLIITNSVLAGLQILTGGAVTADLVGPQVAGLAVLVVAACQGGIGFYAHATSTPNAQVMYERDAAGLIRAGDASQLPTGSVPAASVADRVTSELGLPPS